MLGSGSSFLCSESVNTLGDVAFVLWVALCGLLVVLVYEL